MVVLFAGAGCRGGGRGGLVWVSDDSSLIFISNGVHFGLFLLNLFFAMGTFSESRFALHAYKINNVSFVYSVFLLV